MSDSATRLTGVEGLIGFGIGLIFFFLIIWAHVKIIKKAGYSGWNVLWGFVPVMNVIMIFVFAFSKWPVEEKLARLEAKVFS